MNRPYSTYACKLGGFDLLHSIEDRSLHNAFCPKALIPSSGDFLAPFDKLKYPSKQERLSQVPHACADYTTRLRGCSCLRPPCRCRLKRFIKLKTMSSAQN